ncbi:Secreted RxLR effector peptide protein [Phytophthora cinnamomi]|uniref:Secreted RxLR effector peptide protein n=1 Tax=Phytophthora cinnamomi TaxID=4785 RepID=UPI00355A084D|nr:Secreted RxLR effector peptide protein [Phytophthora cinnamomi]
MLTKDEKFKEAGNLKKAEAYKKTAGVISRLNKGQKAQLAEMVKANKAMVQTAKKEPEKLSQVVAEVAKKESEKLSQVVAEITKKEPEKFPQVVAEAAKTKTEKLSQAVMEVAKKEPEKLSQVVTEVAKKDPKKWSKMKKTIVSLLGVTLGGTIIWAAYQYSKANSATTTAA